MLIFPLSLSPLSLPLVFISFSNIFKNKRKYPCFFIFFKKDIDNINVDNINQFNLEIN